MYQIEGLLMEPGQAPKINKLAKYDPDRDHERYDNCVISYQDFDIFIIGGFESDDATGIYNIKDSVYRYNIPTGRFSAAPSLN